VVDAVRGAAQLEAVGRRLKAAAGAPVRQEMLRGLREGARGTVPKIRESFRTRMPQRGGLAALAAGSTFSDQSLTGGDGVGLRIQGEGRVNLTSLNKGQLSHPVFGNREAWVDQQVPAGSFDEPITEDLPRIRSSVDQALSDLSRKIEKG
jgi:hypothetical protein